MTLEETSFVEVFADALRGRPCTVVGLVDEPVPLPVGDWTREPDAADRSMLALCTGPTVDLGCGPGRLTSALAEQGQVVLGIDVVPAAVGETRRRGGSAVCRDVFGPVPGEGRWATALLADGNIGIGGDPVRLLYRARSIVAPRGSIVVEVAPPGVPWVTRQVVLECAGLQCRPFSWAVVGTDDVAGVAAPAGLVVREIEQLADSDRWCAVLGAAP